MSEFEKRMRDLKTDKKPLTTETKGDKLRKDLKKKFSEDLKRKFSKKTKTFETSRKKTKTFESPMKMERKKEGYRSKVQKTGGNVQFMDELMPLKTLTSEGPGKLEMSKGGRAMLRGGGICKKGMNKKAIGKNS